MDDFKGLSEWFSKLTVADQADVLENWEIECANNLQNDPQLRAQNPKSWEELKHLVGMEPKRQFVAA